MKTDADSSKHRFDTIAIHAARPRSDHGRHHDARVLTSTYVQEGPGEHKGFEYAAR